jgi:uncharacterized iron-regulated membrane protein
VAGPSTFRKVILKLHLWIGLAAALLLLLTGASGALLVFESQIDHALNPTLSRVPPDERTLSLTDLKSSLEQQYPGNRVLGFDISDSTDLAYAAYLRPASGDGMAVAVNQHTGKALGIWTQDRFVTRLHQFHTHLLAGNTGSAVVTWGSIILLFLALSGLILWWRTKIFRVNFQTSGPKFQYDLHSTAGVISLAFLLIFALTGILVHFEDPVRQWANGVSHLPARPQIPKASKPAPGAVLLDPSQLLVRAQLAVPGARATELELAETPERPVLVFMKFPEDHTPVGRTRVFLDPYSGEVLYLTSSRSAPPAVSYATRLNREIHTGDIGGWPTRILAALFSAALPLLAITGPLLWWQRRRRG